MGIDYVHGYSADEEVRLHDQATTLTGLLHAGTRYPAGTCATRCPPWRSWGGCCAP